MLDEHPERGTPVADVVLADDVVPDEREQAAQGVTDDGAAEMTDVHLLGHVGSRVVDHDPLGRGLGHPQSGIGGQEGDLGGDE